MGDRVEQSYNVGVRYGIIADDLTGSCDVGARLTRLGYRPLVQAGPGAAQPRRRASSSVAGESALVILNTRSRDCPRREAADRARAAAELLERGGWQVVYQKIDSTLRGPWTEELKAIVEVTRPDRVLICPAFPACKRFFRHGRLRVGKRTDQPSHDLPESEMPRDLRTMLRRRCDWEVRQIELDVVRRGAQAIRVSLAASKPTRCLIFDAEREGDLQAVGRAFSNFPGRLLWVGSAGLVRHVIPPLSSSESALNAARESPWLLIQGSRQPVSGEQFGRLEFDEAVQVVKFLPGLSRKQIHRYCDTANRALAAGKNLAAVVPRGFDPRVPTDFPRFLHRLLQTLLTAPRLGGIFVTGGDTAEAVCDSLRVRTLRVVEEVCPGIARSFALDGRWPGLLLVTKAGGFGEPEEVLDILRRRFLGREVQEAKT